MGLRDLLLKGSIGAKLLALSVTALVAVLALGLSSIHFVRTTGQAADRVYQQGVVQLMAVSRIGIMLEKHRRIVESAPAEVDRTVIQRERHVLNELGGQLDREIAPIAKDLTPSSNRNASATASLAKLRQLGEKTMFFAENFALDKSFAAAQEYSEVASILNGLISNYRSQQYRLANFEIRTLETTSRRMIMWVCIIVGLIVLLLVPVSMFVLTRVLNRLATIRTVVQDVTHDRIDAAIPFSADPDEIGELARALEHFQANAIALHDTKQRLAQRNEELARFSGELENRVAERTRDALEAADRATQANEKLALKVEEKTRIEGELRAVNERLIAATNAKSQFLANMSHEIRTPMNGVLGMCELLLATSLDNRQHHLARTMRQSASMLLVIINDILDLSRIEAGKVEIESRPFDLDVCLEEVSATLAPTAHGKGLDFGVIIAPDVPRVVTGDAVRLRQILLNLVGNAIKFTGNGEIGVNVELDKPTDGVEKLKIEVRDSGIGISKEQQKHLFENFSQADVSITRKFGGTGLGLAIAKQLVNMMGGEIRLKSQLGDGTSITVTLPLTTSDSTTSLAINEKALRLQTCDKLVAVLSKVPIRRHAVSSQLQRAGLTTRVFDTSLDFLYAVRKEWQPDIVVIDAEPAGTAREKNLDEALAELPDIQIVMTYAIGKHTLEHHENSASQGMLLSYPTNLDALGQLLDTLGATCRDPLDTIEDADTGNYNPSLSGLAILLAEDNPVNQIIATEFLSDFGCDITVVENGREAIDALAGRRFDAVLMDCQMPVMDGLAATRNIRASELRDALQPIPIIAVTANAFASDKKECLEAGMDSFLAKPFAQRDLEIALMQGIATRKELNKAISNSAPRQLESAFV